MQEEGLSENLMLPYIIPTPVLGEFPRRKFPLVKLPRGEFPRRKPSRVVSALFIHHSLKMKRELVIA